MGPSPATQPQRLQKSFTKKKNEMLAPRPAWPSQSAYTSGLGLASEQAIVGIDQMTYIAHAHMRAPRKLT